MNFNNKKQAEETDPDESDYESSENNSRSINDTNDDKSVEIDETDVEEESNESESKNQSDFLEGSAEVSENDSPIKQFKGNRKYRIESDDSSDEEEETQKRKTRNELEPQGDVTSPVEDLCYSKATRRSIHGFESKSLFNEIKDASVSESDSEDSDIIISDDDENDDNDESGRQDLDYSGSIDKKMSSTIRSPLKDTTNTNTTVDNSMSSTVEYKQEPSTSSQTVVKKVSRSFYDNLVAEKEALRNRLRSMKGILRMDNGLPDGGKKLEEAILNMKAELDQKEISIKMLEVDESQNDSIKSQIKQSFQNDSSIKEVEFISENDLAGNFLIAEDVQPKYTGKTGLKNFNEQKALTVEKLNDIHASLNERPGEDVLETGPKHLKVELMRHQLHALAFMMWRETQSPRGGVLADDMGLGKTLTVISLIMKQLEAEENEDNEDYSGDENEIAEEKAWIARGHKSIRDGNTLVVCPATLLGQWEQEIKMRVKRGALEVNVFHGPKRICRAKDLVKFDVVITTYQIILSEHKNDGCIFGVKWDRIVLDEGHVIRNYRSKQSEAVCALMGKRRWVLTGTPIQNKEFDIYAAIKFLRCSPFDDLRYWRTWIETKGGSSPRLQTLLKSILIRRTKQQLQDSGEIQSLPKKTNEIFSVTLNTEERNVYNRFLALSQAIFSQYLAQAQEKHNNYNYDSKQLQKLHQKFAKIMRVDRDIKSHEILTLLLRLRQICCHPGLVKEVIERSELNNDELDNGLNDDANDSDYDILKKLQSLKITVDDGAEVSEVLPISHDDDVFSMEIPSSKIEKMMEIIREKLIGTDDKAIIVSQWVSHLNIIKGMLEVEGIGYCELNGTVPVKFRNDIVVEFNKSTSRTKVMLLSITAGGVGLNLVGANLLLIADPHWNPQIEQQAQDRIYRFGQTKDVKIIKFICEDTIEEKILKIQQVKLEIATSTLTGAKRNATKLTIEDLKSLFGM